jgi:NAD(P)-dependent dehydrogenase (short-subunit alcohol dehydrogenase family)
VYAFMNGVMAAPYAMAKAGVEQLGRALRAELRPHGASASVAYFGFIDTKMVQDTFADPIAQRIEDAFPKFVTKRLQPEDAGAAIVRGVEKRAPRIIAPRWWAAWSTARGFVNPLVDRFTERDKRIQDAVREGEETGSGS